MWFSLRQLRAHVEFPTVVFSIEACNCLVINNTRIKKKITQKWDAQPAKYTWKLLRSCLHKSKSTNLMPKLWSHDAKKVVSCSHSSGSSTSQFGLHLWEICWDELQFFDSTPPQYFVWHLFMPLVVNMMWKQSSHAQEISSHNTPNDHEKINKKK